MSNILNENSYNHKLTYLIDVFCNIHNLEIPIKKNQSSFLVALYEDENFHLIKRSETIRNYNQSELNKMRKLLINQYGEKCMKCQSTNKIEVDHIIPYSWDSSLSLDFNNLQLLCKSCNCKKGNKNSIDFRIYSLELIIIYYICNR